MIDQSLTRSPAASPIASEGSFERTADLPYERIGLALGITPSAARGHASTGLATLRRRLDTEDER